VVTRTEAKQPLACQFLLGTSSYALHTGHGSTSALETCQFPGGILPTLPQNFHDFKVIIIQNMVAQREMLMRLTL